MHRRVLLIIVALFAAAGIWSQATSDFSLTAYPTLGIPLGPKLSDGTNYYSIGGGLALKGEYVLPFAPALYTGVALDADLAPINSAGKSLTLLSAGPMLGLRFSPMPRLNLRAGGYGGYYLGTVEQGSGSGFFFAGQADAGYLLSPSLSLGIGATYKHFLASSGALYQGIGANLGVQYHIGAGRGADIRVNPTILPIFPLFYSYYDRNPAGKLVLKNEGRNALENVAVSFFVKQYMDQPKVSAELPKLAAGQEVEVPVYALFTSRIFSVTEGDKAAGEVLVSYSFLGRPMSASFPVTVTINNRNALTWDDDRKAAAFVTAKDPLILSFAKRVAAGVNASERGGFNGKFRVAMGLFEALSAYGLGYIPDPTTPYAQLSENEQAVDFLQFPGQTLAYMAGDCDDITVLYSALLESVGIQTAFITAPGHIFMAFNTEMDREAAAKTFLNPQELVLRDDGAWVPVEITLVRDGFLKAWQIGAKEWRETSAAGTSAFYPVREAWKTYEPVGFSEIKEAIMLPDADRILREYKGELERFITGEVQPRATKLKEELRRTPKSARLLNSLGVLYARYGLLDDAAAQFQQALIVGETTSALVNLGNVYYLKDDMHTAVSYYNRALEKSPDSSSALLGMARASYELNDYGSVNSALAQLKENDPQTAAKFSFLGGSGETGRASEAGAREVEEWTEE